MTLLVVEDDEANASSLPRQLAELGIKPVAQVTASRAHALLADHPADIIIRSTQSADPAFMGSIDGLCLLAPTILYLPRQLPQQELLQAMRVGVVDVVEQAAGADALGESIKRLQSRRSAQSDQHQRQLDAYLGEIERDQRAGRYIQLGMLPPSPMAIEDYRLRHQIAPSLILSGDFVDYFRIIDRYFAFYLADVSGHGASSAFVTVMLKNFSRRVRREYRPTMLTQPGEILSWLNRELLDQQVDKHVALFIGVMDTQTHTLAYANAGHFPPAILVTEHNDGKAQLLECPGKPLGLFPDPTYESLHMEIAPGDRLVMLSDGVLEVMQENNLQQKEQRLLAAASACNGKMDTLWQALEVDIARSGPDDVTCLMLSRTGMQMSSDDTHEPDAHLR